MRSDVVQAGAARLQYFEHGDGAEVVVLVHGYQASARIWRAAQERFDAARYRVLAFNNRGAGESDRPAGEAAYTVEAFARDLHAAVDTLGLRDFTLVGHSMGGATVAQFAVDHQDVLKALVLLDPAPLDGRAAEPGWEEALRERFRTGEALRSGSGAGAPSTLHEPLPEEYRAALAEDVARNSIERLVAGRRSMSDLRLRGRLRELRLPVLVVGGDQDTTVGVDNIVQEFLALPPERRSLHIIHGAGHSPNIDLPAALVEVLTRFIEVTAPQALAAGSA